MPKQSTLSRFERTLSQFGDEEFIRFHFPVEKPTSFGYGVGVTRIQVSKKKQDYSYSDSLSLEMSGVISYPNEFKGIPCDFFINDQFKTKDIEDGFLGFGEYEGATNRFSFCVKLLPYYFWNLVGKWHLENSWGSDVKSVFGDEFWSAISLKALNFREGYSAFSDGDLVIFDIAEMGS
ncbi:hypothetical protein ACJO5Y_16370 [Marinobacter sp. GN3S48]|uniref:hypothetical protein n=1 Tax=Marinobacter sp. GN3S48 TaxID=3382302 RepID=UPI00387B9B39